jgi:sec-independent protein translocase protein TatA
MFGGMNMMEMVILFGVAVLLFGKRLPEVGRTLGKGIVEFKKGIRGIEEEFRFDEHSTRHNFNNPEPLHTPSDSDLIESSVPKFEPPTAAPVRQPDQPAPVVTKD